MRELILALHGVGEPPPGTDRCGLIYWWDQEAFHTLLDLARASEGSPNPLVITFDDGNASDAHIALPALVRRNLKARFFVCAGRIGLPGYLDRAAIIDLVDAGMTVGSHGMHHVDWRKANADRLETETSGAICALEQLLGRSVDEVAIPFGSYDRRVIAKLREQRLRRVYTSDGGYASTNAWLKVRNSLDRSWQGVDVVQEIRARDQLPNRLRQIITKYYKSIRAPR